MKEFEYVLGIYHYFKPFALNPEPASFYFLYFFDQHGFLDLKEAQDLYLNHFKEQGAEKALEHSYIGPFESIEKLNQYAFRLCEELDAKKINLISASEYNSFLESSTQAAQLASDILEKGNALENLDKKKPGLFKRLFH